MHQMLNPSPHVPSLTLSAGVWGKLSELLCLGLKCDFFKKFSHWLVQVLENRIVADLIRFYSREKLEILP